MDSYLTKPFSISELSESIQQFGEQMANHLAMSTGQRASGKIRTH